MSVKDGTSQTTNKKNVIGIGPGVPIDHPVFEKIFPNEIPITFPPSNYDNVLVCPDCGGHNVLKNDDYHATSLLEADTVCKSCGRVAHWIHGFYEVEQPD